jgi:hypothetical protein
MTITTELNRIGVSAFYIVLGTLCLLALPIALQIDTLPYAGQYPLSNFVFIGAGLLFLNAACYLKWRVHMLGSQ